MVNPYKHLPGYVAAKFGKNGWFCVFDRANADESWRPGRHQWLVKLMPDGPEKTSESKTEAIALAELSSETSNRWATWWVA